MREALEIVPWCRSGQTGEMKMAARQDLKAWAERWRHAAKELDALKAQELTFMTEADAARIVFETLPESDYAELAERPEILTGLVEQQRIFGKLR